MTQTRDAEPDPPCHFIVMAPTRTLCCTYCGRTPEGVLSARGPTPEACKIAARKAKNENRNDRMERGGMTR